MRQIETKRGKNWRCIKSIEATKKSSAQSDAFGQTLTADNTSQHKARVRARLKPLDPVVPGHTPIANEHYAGES